MDLISLDGVDAYTAITRLSEQVEAFEAANIYDISHCGGKLSDLVTKLDIIQSLLNKMDNVLDSVKTPVYVCNSITVSCTEDEE